MAATTLVAIGTTVSYTSSKGNTAQYRVAEYGVYLNPGKGYPFSVRATVFGGKLPPVGSTVPYTSSKGRTADYRVDGYSVYLDGGRGTTFAVAADKVTPATTTPTAKPATTVTTVAKATMTAPVVTAPPTATNGTPKPMTGTEAAMLTTADGLTYTGTKATLVEHATALLTLAERLTGMAAVLNNGSPTEVAAKLRGYSAAMDGIATLLGKVEGLLEHCQPTAKATPVMPAAAQTTAKPTMPADGRCPCKTASGSQCKGKATSTGKCAAHSKPNANVTAAIVAPTVANVVKPTVPTVVNSPAVAAKATVPTVKATNVGDKLAAMASLLGVTVADMVLAAELSGLTIG